MLFKKKIILVYLVLLGLFCTFNAWAATLYVDASLKADCKSQNYSILNRNCSGFDGNAYNTLQKAVNASSAGDTIKLRGGTWSEKRITIKKNNLTVEAYMEESPVIDCNQNDGSVSNKYAKILLVDGADGVILDGLELREYQIGLYYNYSPNGIVRNCNIHSMWTNGVTIIGSPNFLMEDTEVHDCAQNNLTGPANMILRNGSHNSIIRRCKIYDSSWEGLDIGYNVENVLVEYCKIYGNDVLQLYFGNVKNCIARYNLIFGTPEGDVRGIEICHEKAGRDPYYNGYNKIYGNIVANTSTNMTISTQVSGANINNEVYNNTFVEAISIGVRIGPNTGGGHIFKNNIIWQTAGYVTNSIASSWIAESDYNLWSRAPDSDMQGIHDPSYAVPKLIKTSGWNRLKSNDLLGKDFALQNFSPAIGKGFPLNNIFNKILECDESQWPSKVVVIEKNKSHWDIGADNVSSTLSPPFLPSPSLQIVFNKN